MSSRGRRFSIAAMIRFAATAGSILSSLANCARPRSYSSTETPEPVRADSAIRVLIPPGCTTVTPIPFSASSCRTASVNPRTANLLAEYAACPAGAKMPNTLDTLTRCEPGCALSAGSIAWVSRTTARKLTAMTQSNSSRVTWSKRPPRATPALLTSSVVSGCSTASVVANRSVASSSDRSTT